MTQSNLEIFKSIIERGFSRGDLSVADEVCAERLVEHEYLSKTDVPGPEILKSQIEDARRSIKDLKSALMAKASTERYGIVWVLRRFIGASVALEKSTPPGGAEKRIPGKPPWQTETALLEWLQSL